MSNPFDGLISMEMKQLHCNAILEMVRGASIQATLTYGTTKSTECPNCIYDALGKKSSNRYKTGGPRLFSGICPHCNGLGILAEDTTSSVSLVPIYSQKNWCNKITVNTPKNTIATFSLPDTYNDLKRAKELILSDVMDDNIRLRYMRYSEPLPCGLGMTCVIETIWERIEN